MNAGSKPAWLAESFVRTQSPSPCTIARPAYDPCTLTVAKSHTSSAILFGMMLECSVCFCCLLRHACIFSVCLWRRTSHHLDTRLHVVTICICLVVALLLLQVWKLTRCRAPLLCWGATAVRALCFRLKPALVHVKAVPAALFCMRLSFVMLCTGRIWCSASCRQISAATASLVREPDKLGCTASALPPSLGITYTRGESDRADAQTNTILPAAIGLLLEFKRDSRSLRGVGKVMLVNAFVRRCHPLWYFNNAVTLTLWALAPSRDANSRVNLKVTCWI